MGYNRNLDMDNFKFKEDVTPKDILGYFNEHLCKSGFRCVDVPSSGAWRTAREAFYEWGFKFESETMELSFESGYLGDEDKMFEVIAPLVEAGSFIHSNDDFGESRLVFDGQKLEIKKPSWD